MKSKKSFLEFELKGTCFLDLFVTNIVFLFFVFLFKKKCYVGHL